ncbi:hypothetical protein [Planobispora rosea]|uniref:hypothetical protein n=1 Tax=Planobispora rosea TaxID=35762 RepID=UPI00083B7420|nr:hypothetical protein [Planobispora rosea]
MHLIGVVNQTVFQLTRGRVVLYRFHVLAAPDEAGRPGWTVTLLTAEPADIVTVETGNHSFGAEVTRLGAADSIAMMDRLLRPLSLGERHAVRRQRLVPVARLTARNA